MITLMLIVVLFFGVRITVGFNYTARTFHVQIVILKRWYIFAITLRVVDGKWYYSINNGPQKSLVYRSNKRYASFRLPHIKLYSTRIGLYISAEDIIMVNMIGGIYVMLCEYLQHNTHIEVGHLDESLHIVNDFLDVKFYIDATIRWSIIKIIFEYLRMTILDRYYRRKYGTQSNRRTDAVHTG